MLLFTRSTNLTWPEDGALELMDFRVLQLRMRVHEMQQAYKSFQKLLNGTVVPQGMDAEQVSAFSDALRDSVDMSSVVLAGHSFGGATCLQSYDKMPVPVTHVLALDPWFEPLILGEEKYGFKWPKPPPTLVINSQGFTEWKEVWPGEKRICATLGATLVTIGGLGRKFKAVLFKLTSRPGLLRLPAYHFVAIKGIWQSRTHPQAQHGRAERRPARASARDRQAGSVQGGYPRGRPVRGHRARHTRARVGGPGSDAGFAAAEVAAHPLPAVKGGRAVRRSHRRQPIAPSGSRFFLFCQGHSPSVITER